MSYIYNSFVCEVCNKPIDYVWLLADEKFETIPSKSLFVFADYNRLQSKYEVNVKCPKCNSVSCFEYTLAGKYIGKRS